MSSTCVPEVLLIADDKKPSDLVRYSHLGVQFAIILLVAVYGGARLDKRLSTGGLFTILGTLVGASIGFYVLYREVQKATGSDSEPPHPADDRSGDGGGDPHDPDRRS